MFAGDLALALGCTLATVAAMSAAEFAFWKLYRDRRGLPFERIEAAQAIAGAAACRAWGAKVDPQDLLPRFGSGRNMAELAARLAAMPGAKVVYIPKPEAAQHGG